MSGCDETFFVHNSSEEANARYVEETERYLQAPCPPCTREKALKLLKKFTRAEWSDFWTKSVAEYLPTVSEGTMKLQENVRPHGEAMVYAKSLILSMDEKALARDFLYGVAHNRAEYRTALIGYYYIKNLPEHSFERKYIGRAVEDVYSETTCEVCGHVGQLSKEPKMRFWHANVDMECFYFHASYPICCKLHRALTFLEEYKRQPRPSVSRVDLEFFYLVISEIERAPENTTPATLRKIFKSGVLKFMTIDQIDAFIDALGYLDILHKPNTFGVTVKHTQENQMEYPDNSKTYFAYPVYTWKRKYGIDYQAIERLFGDLYE